MSQFAEPVIPDESAYAGEIRNPVKVTIATQSLEGRGDMKLSCGVK
jgi:hypothetical protein